MRAGGLRKYRIEIQCQTETVNVYGEREKVWSKCIETNADVITKSGTRINDVNELTPLYSVEFRIRKYHDVNEKMRILFNGRKYRILAVIPTTERAMKTIVGELINEG